MNLTFMATTTPQTKYGDLYALSWKNYLLRLVQNYATLSRHDWYDVMCIGYKFNLILIINIGSYIYGHIHVWTTVADFHFLMCNHIGWIIGLSNSACSSCRCWVEGRRRLVSRSWEWRCRLRLHRRPCPAERRASLSWLGSWLSSLKERSNLFIQCRGTSFRWRTCRALRHPTPGSPGPRREWSQMACCDQSRSRTVNRQLNENVLRLVSSGLQTSIIFFWHCASPLSQAAAQ